MATGPKCRAYGTCPSPPTQGCLLDVKQSRGQAFAGFLIIFLILAYKANDALTLPQFFAEDVSVFFKDQLGHSIPQLWLPYAGYLHVLPRLVAWMSTLFGMAKAPLVYNLSAIVLDAAAISYTCFRLRSVIPFPLALFSFAAVPLSGEILGTITNAQWFLQFALAAACIAEPNIATAKRSLIRYVAVFLVAVTGPFSIILMLIVVGLCIASWLDRRLTLNLFDGHLATFPHRIERRVTAAIAVGAIIQVVVLLTHAPETSGEHRAIIQLLKIAFTELAPIHVFGMNFLTGNGWIVVYAVLLWSVLVGKQMNGSRRLFIFAMFTFASAVMFAPISMRDVTPVYQFMLADRYFYAFKVTIWWLIYAALVSRGTLSRSEAAFAVATLIGLVAIANPDHLRRQPFVDYNWKETAKSLKSPGPHTIYANPAGWGVVIDVTPSSSSQPNQATH